MPRRVGDPARTGDRASIETLDGLVFRSKQSQVVAAGWDMDMASRGCQSGRITLKQHRQVCTRLTGLRRDTADPPRGWVRERRSLFLLCWERISGDLPVSSSYLS
jgi:hypothetical protein